MEGIYLIVVIDVRYCISQKTKRSIDRSVFDNFALVMPISETWSLVINICYHYCNFSGS